jgi:hypothetical protein
MLLPAPVALLKNNFPSFGKYNGPIEDTSVASWQSGFLDRRFKRKGWIYTGIYNAEIALGFAIADTGYLGKAFIYCYHFPTQTFVEEAAQFPFYYHKDFMPSLKNEWLFKQGKLLWHIAPNGNDLEFKFEGKKLKADFVLHSIEKGMSVVAPAGNRPFNFTYKHAAINVTAEIVLNSNIYKVNGNDAVLDFTLGFPPRDTRWNWASATGKTINGDTVGINLVAYFNGEMENVLLLNGKIISLSKALFQYEKPADKSNWHITTNDSILEMQFSPSGARKDYINAGILKHQFVQPFGKFEGTLLLEGNKIPFVAYGVTEEHHSLW